MIAGSDTVCTVPGVEKFVPQGPEQATGGLQALEFAQVAKLGAEGAGRGYFAVENRADSQSAKRERTKAELRSAIKERANGLQDEDFNDVPLV